jgi:hypothetical protein
VLIVDVVVGLAVAELVLFDTVAVPLTDDGDAVKLVVELAFVEVFADVDDD